MFYHNKHLQALFIYEQPTGNLLLSLVAVGKKGIDGKPVER